MAITDKNTRQNIDHYGSELLTTAALFAGGRVGIAATVVLYGLSSASPTEKWADQAEDFALGALKGGGMRAIFAGANYLPTAPLKGVVTGIGSRTLGNILNRDTFSDPSTTIARLKNDTFSGQAMAADAITLDTGRRHLPRRHLFERRPPGQQSAGQGHHHGCFFWRRERYQR